MRISFSGWTEERRKIAAVYAAFLVSVFFSLLPYVSGAVLAVITFAAAAVAVKTIRKKVAPDSLSEKHMKSIIRSIWIATGFVGAMTIVASILVISFYDIAPLIPCVENLADGGNAMIVLQPCLEPFVATNKDVFIIGMLIASFPGVPYFIVQMVLGLWQMALFPD